MESALSSSLALPLETLSAAEHFRRAQRLPRVVDEFVLASSGSHPTKTFGELPVQPHRRLDEIGHADLIFIPALWRNPRRLLARHGQTVREIQRLANDGATVCAVGTGSYLLAATDLLNEQPGTTHWHYLDEFARLFPLVRLQRQHLITQAGDLYCAGSVNSVTDLMVHLIAGYYDETTARHVESQFSPEIRRSFESYSFVKGQVSAHTDELVMEAQTWLLDHLTEAVSMKALANQLSLSSRTLQRRFHQAMGLSPSRYLQRARLQQARDLLRFSNLAIGEVASRCGFSDASYFSARFRHQMRQSPQQYRRQVRRKLFSPAEPETGDKDSNLS